MQIRRKCRSLVLKPLTRHYTLIPIFDPYRFLMSNQYRAAGAAIPKSIRVHGGGSPVASAAGLLERRPADASKGRRWRYSSGSFFCLHRGHGRTRADTGGDAAPLRSASLKAWRASCPAPRRHGRQQRDRRALNTSLAQVTRPKGGEATTRAPVKRA